MNFGTRKIKIHVYAGDHNPPHCHVTRGGRETRVAIPTLVVLTGPQLSKEERNLVISKMDELCQEFEKLNPNHHKKDKQ